MDTQTGTAAALSRSGSFRAASEEAPSRLNAELTLSY